MLQVFTNVAVIVGTVLALWQLCSSNKNNKHNNELKNCPDFYFTAPEKCDRFGVGYCSGGDFTPKLIEDCDGASHIYLFNIVNGGKFAAKNVRICALAEHELWNIAAVHEKRWTKINHYSGFPSGTQSGDIHQICVRKGELNIFAEERSFFVLLEYRSSYTHKKYKRVYRCCIKDSIDMELYNYFNDDKNVYGVALNLAGKTHSFSLDKKLEDDRIISAVKDVAREKCKDLLEEFDAMGFKRPVIIHDIKLINENHCAWRNIIPRYLAKLRKKFLRVQPLDDWLLDI